MNLKKLFSKQDSLSFIDYKQKIIAMKQSAIDKRLSTIQKILEDNSKFDEQAYAKFILIEANQDQIRSALVDMRTEVNTLIRELRVVLVDRRKS